MEQELTDTWRACDPLPPLKDSDEARYFQMYLDTVTAMRRKRRPWWLRMVLWFSPAELSFDPASRATLTSKRWRGRVYFIGEW